MEREALILKIRQIIEKNTVEGHSKSKDTDFTFIKPSPEHYEFQYFWDCCFHVFILCALDGVELAKKCLSSLFAMQHDDGFVGHIHYWNNVLPARATDIFQNSPSIGINLLRSHTSSLIQPPFVALALERIWETSEDGDYLREMLPKLKKYFDWLAENRDFNNDGLLTIITSFESGMDWKPSYDSVVGFKGGQANWKLFWKMIDVDFRNFLRNYNTEKIKKRDKFRVKDAGFNTVYYLNLAAMARLSKTVKDRKNAPIFENRAEKAKNSIEALMYDEADAAFYDVAGKENRKLKTPTPTILFPLAIDGFFETYSEKVLKRHYFNRKEFRTDFPIPSVSINHPSFNPGESKYLWRGPTWVFNNWFIHRFILKNHHPAEAERLERSVRQLIEKSGFREYYNPFTGEGHGAHRFTWAGLWAEMMA